MANLTRRPSLMDLPPEIHLQILALLPIRSLLYFSLTSRAAYALHLSSLHTLNFAMYPNRKASIISRFTPNPLPDIASTHSALYKPPSFSPTSTTYCDAGDRVDDNPYTINLIIPDAQDLDPTFTYAFHSALHTAILMRYNHSLQHLHLNLWTLSPCISTALNHLPNLLTLSLHISPPYRAVLPRQDLKQAWPDFVLSPRLTTLHLSGANITASQLTTLTQHSPNLRELGLIQCPQLTTPLWPALAQSPTLCKRLEVLIVDECGGVVDAVVRSCIGNLRALKFLALLGVQEEIAGEVERWNAHEWHIEEVVVQRAEGAGEGGGAIEVDPVFDGGGVEIGRGRGGDIREDEANAAVGVVVG